jgi:Spy/CpxP family protein refolding chaperone
MKKIKKLVIIATALLFMAGYTASAQMEHDHNNQGLKQGMMMQNSEMMQGMMNNGMCPMCGQMTGQNMPMKKYGMMVNRLPNLQQQLSLTDDQVDKLFDLQTEFKKQQLDYQAELRKKQMKLKSLLADDASASQVKNQMEACSETKINMKVAAYETAGKMKEVLTNEQKEQLQNTMMQQGSMMKGGMMQGKGGMMNQGQDGMIQNRGGMMQNQNNQ